MLKPLLQISTQPARYEYEVTRARLEMSTSQPTVNRTVKRASLNMRRQAGRVEMSTVRRRSDMGQRGIVDQARYQAQKGMEQARKKTIEYVEMGNQLANAHKGNTIPDSLWSQTMSHNKGDLVLMPVSPIELHYVPAQLAMDFQPGEISADWNLGKARLDYVPGSFNLNFTQYASINIEYTGGFNYVPASSNPNFEATA